MGVVGHASLLKLVLMYTVVYSIAYSQVDIIICCRNITTLLALNYLPNCRNADITLFLALTGSFPPIIN